MEQDKNNPFSPGGIVKTSLFGGRHEYIIQILKKLSSIKNGKPASFYLFGERGIGKTALAKLISFISTARDNDLYNLDFLVSYYGAQQHQDFKSILESSLNNIADQIDEPLLKKIGSRLGSVFKNGKFSIGAFGINAGYENRPNISNETLIIKDQVVSILRNIINQLKENPIEGLSKNGILIIIDEMDNINDINIAASVIRGITTELDFEDLGHLSFLLIGYESSYEVFVRGDESIRRLIDSIHLTEMPENEVIETFEKGFNAANIGWDKEELKKNVLLTGGYPLAIQVLGYHLVESDTNNYIDKNEWAESIGKSSFELIDKEFSSYYSFRTRQKKNTDKILISLAIASSNCDSLSLKEIERLSEVKNPSQYVKQLLKNGVVTKDRLTNEFRIKRGLLRTSIILDLRDSLLPEEFVDTFLKITNVAKQIGEKKNDKKPNGLDSLIQ